MKKKNFLLCESDIRARFILIFHHFALTLKVNFTFKWGACLIIAGFWALKRLIANSLACLDGIWVDGFGKTTHLYANKSNPQMYEWNDCWVISIASWFHLSFLVFRYRDDIELFEDALLVVFMNFFLLFSFFSSFDVFTTLQRFERSCVCGFAIGFEETTKKTIGFPSSSSYRGAGM